MVVKRGIFFLLSRPAGNFGFFLGTPHSLALTQCTINFVLWKLIVEHFYTPLLLNMTTWAVEFPLLLWSPVQRPWCLRRFSLVGWRMLCLLTGRKLLWQIAQGPRWKRKISISRRKHTFLSLAFSLGVKFAREVKNKDIWWQEIYTKTFGLCCGQERCLT